MSNLEVVASPDELTPEWLTEALHAAGVAKGARIDSFTSKAVGTGQMARSFRLALEWDDKPDDAPKTLVGKFPSDNPMSRATGAAQGAYAKEVGFYREIAGSVAIRAPHCHLAMIDDAGADFVLLLEDISPAEQGDQIRGCSGDEASVALRELANLHAPRWGDETLAAHEFLTGPSVPSGQLLQAFYGSVFPGFRDRYAERLAPEALGVAERLGGHLASWVSHSIDQPLTVIHGDYRLDNLLFGKGDGAPAVAVVDWQTVARGVGTSDASYFLGAGLSVELRRSQEHGLMREYWEALRTAGVGDYTWETCWEDYRRATFAGVLMAVVASMIVERTDRGDDMFIAMASRHAQHALDLDAEDLLKA